MVNQYHQVNAALTFNDYCSLFSQIATINYNNFPLSITNKHQMEWRPTELATSKETHCDVTTN